MASYESYVQYPICYGCSTHLRQPLTRGGHDSQCTTLPCSWCPTVYIYCWVDTCFPKLCSVCIWIPRPCSHSRPFHPAFVPVIYFPTLSKLNVVFLSRILYTILVNSPSLVPGNREDIELFCCCKSETNTNCKNDAIGSHITTFQLLSSTAGP